MKAVGIGAAVVDLTVLLPRYPLPDEKLKAKSTMVAPGGNCLNSCMCLRRLGVEKVELITKVGDDDAPMNLPEECRKEGIITDHIVREPGKSTPISIVLVDEENKTRTCVGTRSLQLNENDELPMDEILEGCNALLLDGRHGIAAVKLAQAAKKKDEKIHVIMDAETSDRPYFWEMLQEATILVTNAEFPEKQTEESDLLLAMSKVFTEKALSAKTLITTRGARGCVAMQRYDGSDHPAVESIADVDAVKEAGTFVYKSKRDSSAWTVYSCPAEKIPPELIKDTTGAGDAFVATVAFAAMSGFDVRKTLNLATHVSACKCQSVGAHNGIPKLSEIPKHLLL